MALLCDHKWRTRYASGKHDLVREFYVPLLSCARRYDRMTGYFNAHALTLAARGIEGLVRNDGRMRLLVGCTLDQPEVEAIARGESLREAVSRGAPPLDPRSPEERDALELLAWMVGRGVLEVKVAVPCDEARRPVASNAIFHSKSGVVEDKTGDRLAFVGSINETAAGWQGNVESFHAYCAWEGPSDAAHAAGEDEAFAEYWGNRSAGALVLDVPTAVRDDLLRFLPEDGRQPRRLGPPKPPSPTPRPEPAGEAGEAEAPLDPPPPPPPPPTDLRRLVWGVIEHGPAFQGRGERVGEATCAVTPWPHQVRAFERMYRAWPPRLLIADEVGLGKTIEAGLLLRQAWLAKRARRILVLAPRAVLRQWQLELREKFNLNWPVYDGKHLTWYPSKALLGRDEREVGREEWHREPCVIVSSQLMRREDRRRELLEHAERYDLVVLDEAHHARRYSPGSLQDRGPNRLLALMQGLKDRTEGLVLLTATPMQVHPVEVYDLLALLGLPAEWTAGAFLEYFNLAAAPNPSHEAMERMCVLARSIQRHYGAATEEDVVRIAPGTHRFVAGKVLRALQADAASTRRGLETDERALAVRFLRRQTPVGRLVSRFTRKTLRRYQEQGKLSLRIAQRRVADRLIELSADERSIYERVEDYISTTWDRASPSKRNAVGFVMTVYRKRLASSFAALARTLEGRRGAAGAAARSLEEDLSDDETSEDEPIDAEDAVLLSREALASEETSAIERLLDDIRRLPADSKAARVVAELEALRRDGYAQAIVFTQYTDTVDFLRDHLVANGSRVVCFSGRGGERRSTDGRWTKVSREDVRRQFKAGEADVLLCTDSAAEGLNFQFCGALVNYDMPWNPMRVEQRIGRIDRLGQQFPEVRIVNLLYEDTVEADVYVALRDRIRLFEQFVGGLQPILATLSGRIATTVRSSRDERRRVREGLVREVAAEAARPPPGGLDLDEATDDGLALGPRPAPVYGMADLDRVLQRDDLRPPGVVLKSMGPREYALTAPGMPSPVRVTTDPAYYEEHPESTELWSPGSPAFLPPFSVASPEEAAGSDLKGFLGC